MSQRAAIEPYSLSAPTAAGSGAESGLAPAPGDGGTPALERQDPGWANAASDKKGAAKRLVNRVKRKVANSNLVRKLKHGKGFRGGDSSSDESGDDGSQASEYSSSVSN